MDLIYIQNYLFNQFLTAKATKEILENKYFKSKKKRKFYFFTYEQLKNKSFVAFVV